MSDGQRSSRSIPRLAAATLVLAIGAAVVEYWPQETNIQWRTWTAARVEAEATGRPIYLDLYAEWCGPCKQMDRLTFTDDSVQRVLHERYIPARLDIDTPEFSDSLKKAWNLKGVPTSMILGPRGDEWRRQVGFQTAAELTQWLSDTTLTTTASWRMFVEARAAAGVSRRPMLIVVAANGEQVEAMEEFFADSTMRTFVSRTFEPTLIVRNGPSGRWIDTLRVYTPVALVPEHGFLLIVMMPDGRDLGQLPVHSMELEDHAKIRRTLEGFVRR